MTANGTLPCRNATIEGTIHSDNGDDEIYIRNGRMQIYYDGKYIGLIGGNGFKDEPDIAGLNFDLEYTGDYMTWASKESSSASNYIVKMTYVRKDDFGGFGSFHSNTVNFGCAVDMHNYELWNVKWPRPGITATMKFVQITGIDSNGNVTSWGSDAYLEFTNGILTDIKHYAKYD